MSEFVNGLLVGTAVTSSGFIIGMLLSIFNHKNE